MPTHKTVSRRKFILASGGAALLAVGFGVAPALPEGEVLASQAARCGVLRVGYSTIGGVRPGRVESQHARQIAMMLWLWQPDGAPRFDASGDLSVRAGTTDLSALMTTLTARNGARVEIVTAASPLSGPEMTFRGAEGIMQAGGNRIRFTEAVNGMPDGPAKAVSEDCWKAYCDLCDSMCPSEACAGQARLILADARARLMRAEHIQRC